MAGFDCDVMIIGSGSVEALQHCVVPEKGYRLGHEKTCGTCAYIVPQLAA